MPAKPKMPADLCQFLEWDSHFFGRRIARLRRERLTLDVLKEALDWCQASRIECLYFLADANDLQTSDLVCQYQFRLVDTRVTLGMSLDQAAPGTQVDAATLRPFRPEDLPALRDMAGHLHEDSRFFVDKNFSEERARELFRVWITKTCEAPVSRVFVGVIGQRVAGYIACSVGEDSTGRIELMGVAPFARGQGLGTSLVGAGLRWLASKGSMRALVVTQGRNIAAQRLYQRCGFTTSSMQYWFHRWFEPVKEK